MSTDKITTWFGAIAAVGVAVMDYFSNLGPSGLNLKSPLFWAGLVVAGSLAVQAYYTNK